MKKLLTLISLMSLVACGTQTKSNSSLANNDSAATILKMGKFENESDCKATLKRDGANLILMAQTTPHPLIAVITPTNDQKHIDGKIGYKRKVVGNDGGLIKYVGIASATIDSEGNLSSVKIAVWDQIGGLYIPGTTRKVECEKLIPATDS